MCPQGQPDRYKETVHCLLAQDQKLQMLPKEKGNWKKYMQSVVKTQAQNWREPNNSTNL